MARVRGFILSHFTKSYLLIFLPFLAILSIIYIIRIASLSSKISLDGYEILELFSFFAPEILFYTIPLSFIAALTATLMRLSEDNELIALFSFGLTPVKLLKIFLLPSFLFTVLMLILSLSSMPKSKLSFKVFEGQKLAEAKLTIAPNKLGQKFGEYIIFIGDKKDDRYRDVVLFATNSKYKRVIFIADEGSIESNSSRFTLNLFNGSGDTFLAKTIESIDYQQMSLYSYPQNKANIARLRRGWSEIGENRKDMALFIYNIFLSLSPLLALGIIAAFSIINPRYERAHVYLVSFGVTISIYAVASFLKKQGTPMLLLLFCTIYVAIGIYLFQKRTRKSY